VRDSGRHIEVVENGLDTVVVDVDTALVSELGKGRQDIAVGAGIVGVAEEGIADAVEEERNLLADAVEVEYCNSEMEDKGRELADAVSIAVGEDIAVEVEDRHNAAEAGRHHSNLDLTS